MVRTKTDPRKEVGSTVHVKCTNVFSTSAECSRVFGRSYKAIYCDGEVKEVEVRKSDAGRNTTYLTVEFKIAGVMEVTRTLSLSKVYAGPAPGPRPPSPDVEIVTPARVATLNRDDHSSGMVQGNLHRTPRTLSEFFGISPPDGFAAMQRQRLQSFGKKKQRTSKRKASNNDQHKKSSDDNTPTMPSFSAVSFT